MPSDTAENDFFRPLDLPDGYDSLAKSLTATDCTIHGGNTSAGLSLVSGAAEVALKDSTTSVSQGFEYAMIDNEVPSLLPMFEGSNSQEGSLGGYSSIGDLALLTSLTPVVSPNSFGARVVSSALPSAPTNVPCPTPPAAPSLPLLKPAPERQKSATRHSTTYPCSVCGKVFNQSGNLSRHKVVHTGERSFKCDICGKGFTQKSHVRTHQSVHTGVKAFQCTLCDKSFSQLGHLNGHLERHLKLKKANNSGQTRSVPLPSPPTAESGPLSSGSAHA
eukprot:m.26980 g.26980  ORF g.26980 m.26980 type:complete len:276 (-) comp6378_c0_seq2:909-1736(-)